MKHNSDSPTKYVLYFVIVVLIAAIISTGYKIVKLISESTLNNNTANFILVDENAYLIHIDKKQKRFVTVKFPSKGGEFVNRSNFSSSVLLGVPVEGVIVSSDKTRFQTIDKEKGLSFTGAINIAIGRGLEFRGMNQFDILKAYYYYTKADSDEKIFESNEKLSGDFRKNDKILKYDLYRDQDLFNDRASVEIVNSTGIDGLGMRLGDIFKNVGINVVSIKSGSSGSTKITTKLDESFIAERIAGMTDFSLSQSGTDALFDVTVVIGKDVGKGIE